MKAGIIVFSQTGNTLDVANKVKEELAKKGYLVEITKLEIESSDNPMNIKLKSIPDINPYDVYVFASPVQAFGLASPMKAFLKAIPSLEGKKAAVYVTQQLSPFFGGNRSIRTFKKLVELKGGSLVSSDIIGWKSEKREDAIASLAQKIANSL